MSKKATKAEIERAAKAVATWWTQKLTAGDRAAFERSLHASVTKDLAASDRVYYWCDADAAAPAIDSALYNAGLVPAERYRALPRRFSTSFTTRLMVASADRDREERIAIDPHEALEFGVKYELMRTDIDDLITTAWEGGDTATWVAKADRRPVGPRYECKLTTVDGDVVELNLDKILAALRIVATRWPRHFRDFIDDSGDATTADVIIQVAALGDIVYG